jgi:iron complex outermembrane recepter protein
MLICLGRRFFCFISKNSTTKKFIVFFALALLYNIAGAQQVYDISGKVADEAGNALTGVVLHFNVNEQTTVTGAKGEFYAYGLPEGELVVICHYLGYEIFTDTIRLVKNLKNYQIRLVPVAYSLEGVEISESKNDGRKKSESMALETVSADFIARNVSGDMMKTLSRLPGVASMDIGSGASKPIIRGLGFNRVVVAEAGINHEAQQWGADHGLEIDQFNVVNAEVIKGPASLLYGSDAIGGVVRLEPFAIPVKDGAQGKLLLHGQTNNNLAGASADISVKRNNKFLQLRLTGISHSDYRVPIDTVTYNTFDFVLDNNYLRNTAGREINFFATAGIKGKNYIQKFNFGNYYRKAGFYADAHGFEIRNSSIDYDSRNRDIDLPYQEVQHLKAISNSAVYLGNYSLKLDLGYQRNDRNEYAEPTEHGYRPMPGGELERSFVKNIFSANALLSKDFGGNRNVSAGLSSEFQDNQIGGWGFIIPAFQRFSAGAFALKNYQISTAISANAGIRFDYGRLTTEPYRDWYVSPVFDDQGNLIDETFALRSPGVDKSFTNLTYSLGMVWRQDQWSAKANIGKAFRMPDARELGADGVNYHLFRQEKGDSTLTSERAWQADISMAKTKDKFQFTVNGFYSWIPNFIYLNPTGDFSDETGLQVFNFVQNKVHRFGGEAELSYQAAGFIKSTVTAEYVYAEQLSGEKKGFGLPFSPPFTANFGLTFTPEINSESFSETWLTLETEIAARQNRIVPPEEPTAGYAVLNLLAGSTLRIGKVNAEIYFQLSNLLNTTYYKHTSYYRLINIPEPGRNARFTIIFPFS